MQDAIALGDNMYYSFCISRKNGGNLFSGYRLKNESTFYFVRFKNKTDKKKGNNFIDPSHYIVIDAQQNGKYQWTWADNGSQGHGTENVKFSKIIKTFPELDIQKYGETIFKNIPLSNDEIKKLQKFENLSKNFSEEEFNNLSLSEKKEYINSEFLVDDISILDKELLNDYLGMGHVIDENQLKSLPNNLFNRWYKSAKQIAIDRNSSPHYFLIAKAHLLRNEKVDEDILKIFFKNSFYSYDIARILIEKGLKVDDRIIDGISKNSSWAYKFARILIEKGLKVDDRITDNIS